MFIIETQCDLHVNCTRRWTNERNARTARAVLIEHEYLLLFVIIRQTRAFHVVNKGENNNTRAICGHLTRHQITLISLGQQSVYVISTLIYFVWLITHCADHKHIYIVYALYLRLGLSEFGRQEMMSSKDDHLVSRAR